MTTSLLVLAGILAASCGQKPAPRPPAPKPVPVEASACERAGARLAELECEEAKGPDGTPFAEACAAAAEDGRDWRPDCIALVTRCDEVTTAYQTPEGEPCLK